MNGLIAMKMKTNHPLKPDVNKSYASILKLKALEGFADKGKKTATFL